MVDEFVTATMTVIARVGYDNATSTRIARLTGRGFSTIYNHYASKEELMVASVAALLDQIISVSIRAFVGLDRDQYLDLSVANAKAIVGPEGRDNRNLRLETVLAARHHDDVRPLVSKGYEAMRAALIEAAHSVANRSIPEADLQQLWLLLRSNNIGMSLIASSTSAYQGIDWTPASAALHNLVTNCLGGAS
jgi:AcrR family transcriptional regulator